MHRLAAVALAAAVAVAACTGTPSAPHVTTGATTLGAGGSGAGGLPGVTSSDPVPVRPAVESSPPRFPLVTASAGSVTVRAGEDWSMPSWARPAANSGFFSEQASPDDRVPGAFTWAEYDYEMIADAVKSGDLTFAAYKAWYDHAWKDLAEIFGPYKDKLVFTGEDYPFGPFKPGLQDGLAAQAVAAGIGIRNGISEESNFHLSEAPAYGSHIQPDGHMVVDESLPVHDGHHVVATENECFDTCGFTTNNVPYAVEQSDLKALQLRMNWIYVVPDQSDMAAERPFWDWVRLSMGQTATTSPDAWAKLRDAEDTYWNDATGPFTSRALWPSKPFVRNLERRLVQRDVPGGVARRTTVDVHTRVFAPENGVAYEGLSTDTVHGQNGLYLDLDQRFLTGPGWVLVKVTYWDAGRGTFVLRYPGGQTVPVTRGGSSAWKTATFRLDHATFDGTLPGGTDLGVVRTGGSDLIVKLVRLVRV